MRGSPGRPRVIPNAPKQKRGTSLTFTPDELLELARYVGAGTVMLQVKPNVAGRIKGALKRLGILPPPGF